MTFIFDDKSGHMTVILKLARYFGGTGGGCTDYCKPNKASFYLILLVHAYYHWLKGFQNAQNAHIIN